jgi:hypothetical protein
LTDGIGEFAESTDANIPERMIERVTTTIACASYSIRAIVAIGILLSTARIVGPALRSSKTFLTTARKQPCAGIEHFKRLFYLEPRVVTYDLHPEYLSTKYALGLDKIETKLGIQHHHAHIASCMADNEIDSDVIGVAMDGLGFGTDERMWGGEVFVANFVEAERIAISLPADARRCESDSLALAHGCGLSAAEFW